MSARAHRVELIYDGDCPNVEQARSLLIQAFTRTGVSARWREWQRGAPGTPDYAGRYGSPTILVDGADVASTDPVAGSGACRMYADGSGRLAGTPPLDALCSALAAASPDGPATTRWRTIAASLPAVGIALLPKLTCPLCFPAYAAVLGAFGLEFVNYTPYLLPLTAAFLVVVMAVLARQYRKNGDARLPLLGIAASALVLAGKFYAESDWITYGGIALLVAAIFLGGRATPGMAAPCPACAPGGNGKPLAAH